MEYVRLGRSGLLCSVMGLGGGSSGRFGLAKGGTKSDALRLIRMALDYGITFFDGAGLTGGVDELLADGLAGRREDIILSTKIHLGLATFPFTGMRLANQASSWAARRFGLVSSGYVLRKRVEQSLVALRSDRIDVLHLHAVSPGQYPLAVERVLPDLLKLKEEGKLRAIGVTEGFLADPGHAMLLAATDDAYFDTIMIGFNVRNPSAAEQIIPAARKADVGIIGMFALRGLLAANSDELHRLVEEAGVGSLSELAYRFCRHHAGMQVVLTGTGDPEHLRQNISAIQAPPLSPAVLDRLRSLGLASAQAGGTSTRK